jgi:ATP-dependent DNA ligase
MNEPRHWRPQRARGGKDVHDIEIPIAEPRWGGTRVLAFFRDSLTDEWGTVEVIDESGDDALPEAMRAFDQLRRSVNAREAIVDGIVTDQAARIGVGIDFAGRLPEDRGDAAFVALDVLRIDDQPLLDVPLLERKRQLDALIVQSPLVRISPWTGRPLKPWYMTWKRAGFRGIVIKSANSRYVPGSVCQDWAITDSEPRI